MTALHVIGTFCSELEPFGGSAHYGAPFDELPSWLDAKRAVGAIKGSRIRWRCREPLVTIKRSFNIDQDSNQVT